MPLSGVRGVRKPKRVRTTRPDKSTVLPADIVNRRFTAPHPGDSVSATLTHVATWSGSAYVAFVTDMYSRRIVGWNVASTVRSEILPMQALDMSAWGCRRSAQANRHLPDKAVNRNESQAESA